MSTVAPRSPIPAAEINKREVADRLWPVPSEPRMSQADMAEVLLACSGYDGREVAPTMVRAWWSKLGGHYTLEVCLAAVTEHYDTESRRMMPVDVIRFAASHGHLIPPAKDNPWSYPNLVRANAAADAAEAAERVAERSGR